MCSHCVASSYATVVEQEGHFKLQFDDMNTLRVMQDRKLSVEGEGGVHQQIGLYSHHNAKTTCALWSKQASHNKMNCV